MSHISKPITPIFVAITVKTEEEEGEKILGSFAPFMFLSERSSRSQRSRWRRRRRCWTCARCSPGISSAVLSRIFDSTSLGKSAEKSQSLKFAGNMAILSRSVGWGRIRLLWCFLPFQMSFWSKGLSLDVTIEAKVLFLSRIGQIGHSDVLI